MRGSIPDTLNGEKMKPIKKQKKDTLFFKKWSKTVKKNNKINPEMYEKFNVKRGLRNNNGSGVLVGLTEIGDVHGYIIDENENIPVEGRLLYRGIEINDLVNGFQKEKRYGFEEIIFLLLFGELPTKNELKQLTRLLTMIDMNVVVTAHEKVKYKDGGAFIADGVTFDCEKKMPYL